MLCLLLIALETIPCEIFESCYEGEVTANEQFRLLVYFAREFANKFSKPVASSPAVYVCLLIDSCS